MWSGSTAARMEGGPQQTQSGPGVTSGTACLPPKPPTPPRLTPNPTLLDAPVATLTPTSNSPPPPLTPAPSLSASSSHTPKAPSTVNPGLRTYSRPIPPSPAGQRSKPLSSSSPTTIQPSSSPLAASSSSSSSCPSSSSTSPSVPSSAPLPVSSSSSSSSFSSSSSHRNTAVSAKTSCCLTNGNTKPVFTATSAPITPFHTPASPTSRQGPQTNPMGIPGLVRANQSPSPARQGLQSLTLRPPPPPPGTLGIPPSLRLKPPLSAPPALARPPRTPNFPPLRPRPQPSATAAEGPTTPTRHLSVAPPGRSAPPPPPLWVITVPTAPANSASSSSQNPPLNKQQPLSPSGQSQSKNSMAASNPMAALSRFDRTPSAARQLQIIALSSGRQGQHSAGNAHTVVQSQSAAPTATEPPIGESLSPLPSSSSVRPPPALPKKTSVMTTMAATSPLPPPPSLLFSPRSPPSLPSPATATSPPGPTGSPPRAAAQREVRREEVRREEVRRESEEQQQQQQRGAREPGRKHSLTMSIDEEKKEPGGGGGGGGGGAGREREPRGERERDNQREEKEKAKLARRESSGVKEEGPVSEKEAELPRRPKVPRLEAAGAEDRTGVTGVGEEGQVGRKGGAEKRRNEDRDGEEATAAGQPENHAGKKLRLWFQNPESNAKPKQGPATVHTAGPELKPVLDLTTTPAHDQCRAHYQYQPNDQVHYHYQSSYQYQYQYQYRSLYTHSGLQNPGETLSPVAMRTSVRASLSSLSSQSPPTSPIITAPQPEPPPPLLCSPPARPDRLDLSQCGAEGVSQKQGGEGDPLDQSAGEEGEGEGEEEMGEGGWMPRAWPEGRQVNRSSLLVREPVDPPPPEENGTNGKEAVSPPVAETLPPPAEHSTDSEEEEEEGGGGAVNDKETVAVRQEAVWAGSATYRFNVRLTKRLRALSASSRTERPTRPTLNRASSVPGKPLLLRLPRDLWSASQRDKGERRGDEKRRKEEEEQEQEEEEEVEEEEVEETVDNNEAADEEEEEEDEEEDEEEEDDDEEEEKDDPSFSAPTKPTEGRAARRPRRASEPAVTTSTPTTTFKPRPAAWSVEDVTAFIHTLPGCSEVAEGFRMQEIDGQALLLLTEDHLMTSMNIKLGPALKICAHINALKNQ
ncbi:hypothetical protein CRUP_028793 [Coryphaenoides rupestris]|nr:hypothetical protein CRUP_028793 [Coryphaenoides rupestris]